MISEKRPAWETRLTQIATQPLSWCPRFPEVAQLWEEWWAFDAPRPLLVASARKRDDIRWDKAFDLIHQPREWLAVRRAQVENTHFVAEALPFVRVDIGPVATAAFLGLPLSLSQKEQTSWQQPTFTSWNDAPELAVDFENPWLRLVLDRMETVAQDASGHYLVCTPDLTGAIDVLANMRHPQNLCLDLFDHPERIVDAAARIVDVWEEIFCAVYDAVIDAGAGIVQWVSCWGNTSHTVPTCDFTALIGRKDFRTVCLPSLREQAIRAGRCVFHLDGPDAARHAETLASEPSITAIQYTPGAGTPSAIAKLDMLRMIQSYGKPLWIESPYDEVEVLVNELDPGGLALRVEDARTPERAEALWRLVEST